MYSSFLINQYHLYKSAQEFETLKSSLGEYIKKTEETDELRIFNGFCSYLGRTCCIYVTEENAEGILTAVFRQKASGFPLRK